MTFLSLCIAYIWYIGHSEKDTGNWCFKDGTISFDDLFDIYKKRNQQEKEEFFMDATSDDSGKLLAIISDCSYSGNWVHRCAKILDDEKIPPCGHKTNDKSLQVRIHCSTDPFQEAQELCYSSKGVEVRKDGDFSFLDTSLTPLQNTCYGDFTKLVCCRGPDDSCRMDEDINDWTWIDIVTGKLRKSIYIIKGHIKDQKCWHIILLFNRGEEFVKQYEVQAKSDSIKTSDWGYILDSAIGEVPPKEIIKKVTQWTFV